MASKLVAFRLPKELIEAIEANAETTGKDKTAVVVHALRKFFELPPADASTTSPEVLQRLADLEKIVEILQDHLVEQEKKLSSVEALQQEHIVYAKVP
jgi:predicted DNA-binding protein